MLQFLKSFFSKDKYRPNKYWNRRHSKYGDDLRGVGHSGLSHKENLEIFLEAKEIFLNLCNSENIDFKKSSILEIGCGIGLFTSIVKEQACENYTGIDISSVPIKRLKKKYPEYNFYTADISKKPVIQNELFDVILMIDVTQHIVDDEKLKAALTYVKDNLKDNGIFVVTSWLSDTRKTRTFYEVERPISFYKEIFQDYKFSTSIPFRSKYLFSIKKK